jgi:hypothetical protein
MKTTRYFDAMRSRSDRTAIKDSWIVKAIAHPEHEQQQADGRIRRWASIDEAGGRWLRVVLLPDGETVHNAFFDRGFEP